MPAHIGSVAVAFLFAACGGSAPAADSPASSASDPGGHEEAADPTWQPESESDSSAQQPADPQNDGEPDAKPPGNTVKETRTPEVIRKVVLKNRQSVRDCYEKELARSPGMRGKLTLHFKLDPKGQVAEAETNEARSTLKNPMLAKCAIEALKKMEFPPSSRGFESTVNYPFNFTP